MSVSIKLVQTSVLTLILLSAFAGTVTVYAKTGGLPSSPNGVRTLSSTSGDEFGYSISSAGGYVAVGSPYETVGDNSQAGRVYVYSESGTLLYTLTSPNSQLGGEFGWSVSVGYGIIIVGAPDETSGGFGLAGNAYVFSISTGDLISSLTSSFPQDNGFFGVSVAAGPVYRIGVADGNLVLVGAPDENAICGDGRAWTFIAEGAHGLVDNGYCSPNPISDGLFGYSVAIGGGYLAVGAYNENSGGGYVHTYHAKSGLPLGTIASPNSQSGGEFGYSLALSTNGILAVGAPGESIGIGNAYTFNVGTGSLIEQVTTTDSKQTDNLFGSSVALGKSSSGVTLVVGAPNEDIFGSDCTLHICDPSAGHAYTFNAQTGSLIKVYTSPNKVTDGVFGSAVSMDGKTPSIGAPGENNGVGYAYIF